MMIMSNKNHVVGINRSEGSKTVSDNAKESYQNAVDDVDDIDLLSTNVDPTDQEKHPCKAEEGDKRGIESDEEAKCCRFLVWVERY
jgi:2,3-bisphosphoglycerate-independent phosphoglycerate mutase